MGEVGEEASVYVYQAVLGNSTIFLGALGKAQQVTMSGPSIWQCWFMKAGLGTLCQGSGATYPGALSQACWFGTAGPSVQMGLGFQYINFVGDTNIQFITLSFISQESMQVHLSLCLLNNYLIFSFSDFISLKVSLLLIIIFAFQFLVCQFSSLKFLAILSISQYTTS